MHQPPWMWAPGTGSPDINGWGGHVSSQEARGGGEREGGVQAPGRRLLLAAWRECPASHLRGQQDPRPPALRVGAEQLNGVQVAGSRAGSRASTCLSRYLKAVQCMSIICQEKHGSRSLKSTCPSALTPVSAKTGRARTDSPHKPLLHRPTRTTRGKAGSAGCRQRQEGTPRCSLRPMSRVPGSFARGEGRQLGGTCHPECHVALLPFLSGFQCYFSFTTCWILSF